MPNEMTVVILAAGQGTRMKSKTAKVLHRAGGKPLVRHAIDAALRITIPSRVFLVVGHQAEQVQAATQDTGIHFVVQTEQLGTGHAVMCGQDRLAGLSGKLMIFYGDCPLIRPETLERLAAWQDLEGACGALVTTDLEDPTGYGRILRDSAGGVSAIVEQKAGTPEQLAVKEINAGVYCFDAAAFWKHIHEIRPDNPAREYYLTDMIAILLRAGHKIAAMKIADPNELLGINNRLELSIADRVLRERKVRELMLSGVTIERPETVCIDASVKIGADTIIGPFVQITGNTVIGEDCRIGASSILENAQLGNGVQVFPFTSISDSALADGAHAGPYARLRMGAQMEENSHVGNFVELKKTKLGAGSKSMHLAYLGDSTIGKKVNVGAGTITCNYDGKKKSATIIGDGAFVGSNSTLVAPLKVGDSAYIAAGSVITDEVPEKVLALGRARQVIKPDWKPKE